MQVSRYNTTSTNARTLISIASNSATIQVGERENTTKAASNRSGRLSISLTIISFQVPLFTLLSFGNDSFFDGHLNSVVMLTASCVIMIIQLAFLGINKPITVTEIMVYAPLLLCTVVLTALIYHFQHESGVDGIKSYVINIAGLATSGVAVIFKMFIERKRVLQNSLPLFERHSMDVIG